MSVAVIFIACMPIVDWFIVNCICACVLFPVVDIVVMFIQDLFDVNVIDSLNIDF